jgi:hypothetical protein
MAYKQYTKCTAPSDFNPLNRPLVTIGGIGGLIAMITALFVAAAVPILGIILILSGGGFMLAAIIATFEYLLGGKLICLGGDKLAVGRVLSVEPASSKSGVAAMDNDYSINMLLCPHEKINGKPEDDWVATDIPLIDPSNPLNYQDFLVQEQAGSSQHGIPYTGYEDASALNRPNFHIELEGSRIYEVYHAFLAAWAVLVAFALAAAALAAIPVIGWLLALLAMLFGAGIGALIVGATWAGSDDGNLNDVDTTIGELHKGDFIVSYGTWTYDAGHNDTNVGWNELHPVKFLSKADHCANEDEAKEWVVKIEETLNQNIRKKKQPLEQNRWRVHPVIDGCSESENIH